MSLHNKSFHISDKLMLNHHDELVELVENHDNNDFSIDLYNVTYRVYPSILNILIYRCRRRKKVIGPKTILRGLNGSFKSGKLSAIMGPSGSGKTTLIECIAGIRVKGFQGDIRLTGKSKVIKAFIPQEDVLCSLLNVREALMYSYGLKVGSKLIGNKPHSISSDYTKEAKASVDQIIQQLNLNDCQDMQIGLISGGEKKRTSIAQELVSKPDILLMDEPTAGLDSCSCYKLIKLLKAIAIQSSMMVIITLHQPSVRAFNLLHQVYMLSYNGRFLFNGLPSQVVPTLTSVGVKCDPFNSPADLLSEVACGEYGYDINDKMSDKIDVNHNSSSFLDDSNSSHLSNSMSNKSMYLISKPLSDCCLPNQVSFLSQLRLLLSRQFKLRLRDQLSTIRVIIALKVVLIIGFLYPGKGIYGGCIPNFSNVQLSEINTIRGSIEEEIVNARDNAGALYFLLIIISLANMMPMAALIPLSMQLFRKEFFNGWYRLEAYFLARNLAELPFILLCTFISVTGVFIVTAQPIDRYTVCLFPYTLVALASSAHGTIFGTLFMHNTISSVFATPNTLTPLLLFSGFFTCIDNMPRVFRFLSSISYLRFGFLAQMAAIFGYDRCESEVSKSNVQVRVKLTNFLDTMFKVSQWISEEEMKSFKNQTTSLTDAIVDGVIGPWFNGSNQSLIFKYYSLQDSDYDSAVVSLIISCLVGQLIALYVTKWKGKATR